MEREEKFLDYCNKYADKGYVSANVPRILENLEKAWNDRKLEAFLLNQKPYISAFPYVIDIHHGARGKDQVAIVLALNIFGADHPEFVFELNALMKSLVKGGRKKLQAVLMLMAAQMELQDQECSMINFVDAELISAINRYVSFNKPIKVVLSALGLVLGAIGMPGSAMIGLIPLTFVCIGLFLYCWYKLAFWLGLPRYDKAAVAPMLREVGNCKRTME